MPTWNPIMYGYTSIQYITQLIYTKQVIEDELYRSKYGKKAPPALNAKTPFRYIIQLLDQVNTYYYNQRYFQYIWDLTIKILIFIILWSVLPMAVTWLLNWFKKKPTTQFQYVRHELKITPTKYTINQDFNVWKRGFERYAKNVTDKTNTLLSLMEESCIEQLEQRLLIRNPNATYEEIIKISSKLFGRNPIYNDPLMEFVLRTQLQNETIFQFIDYLWELFREVENDFNIETEWLHVHRIPNRLIQTTYAFVRLSNADLYPQIVERLNGRLHRNRNLQVKINPQSTPLHVTNAEHSPRIQFELDRIRQRETNWVQERQQLHVQIQNLEQQLQSIQDHTIPVESKLQQLQENPLVSEIESLKTKIQSKKSSLSRWKNSSLKLLVDKAEDSLKILKADLQRKQELLRYVITQI
ncbi:unnamed protein product [Brachionus calyciflorus]|uniref:Uncharacterized protein n=1 Tax=Brachionus calyciflorus TaxID=104777 RepID=A0A814JK64_9BILA|nr:unnamed protein product [Brachionus calyciflorus]